jgi:hypothetical protein
MRVERRNILLFYAVFLLWLSFIANKEFKICHNTEAYIPYEKKSPRVSLDIRQTESNLNNVSDRNAILIFKCVIF